MAVVNTDSAHLAVDHSVVKRFGDDVPATAACDTSANEQEAAQQGNALGIFHAGQVEPRANSLKGNGAIAAGGMPVRGTNEGDASCALTRSQSCEDRL